MENYEMIRQKRLVLCRKIYYNIIYAICPAVKHPDRDWNNFMGRNDRSVKIIDEKGRLFGKLNLIDLLVILLVIAAAVLFFLRRTQPEVQEVQYELAYQVLVTRVSPEIYEAVTQYVDPEQDLTDQMFSTDSNNKLLNSYVVDSTASPHVEYVTTSDGQVKRVESSGDDQRLDVLFTLHAWVTDPMSNQVGTQQIRVGATHYIKTTHFELSGIIQNVERANQ